MTQLLPGYWIKLSHLGAGWENSPITNIRNNFEALIYGSDYSDAPEELELDSVDYSGMGVTVLRDSDSYLLMDYGPHGGIFGAISI